MHADPDFDTLDTQGDEEYIPGYESPYDQFSEDVRRENELLDLFDYGDDDIDPGDDYGDEDYGDDWDSYEHFTPEV